jgi:DNA-binding response OmpR family regulator
LKGMLTKVSKTILLVDGDPELLSILAAAFALEGFRSVTLSRTRDAIIKLRLQKYSAIFLDPDIQGERTAEIFLSATDPAGMNAKTPVVIMSSNLGAEVPAAAVASVKAVLKKPFNLDELLGVVRFLTK